MGPRSPANKDETSLLVYDVEHVVPSGQEEHEITIFVEQMTQEASDSQTDTDTHVIKKELPEGQLSKQLGKHWIIIP